MDGVQLPLATMVVASIARSVKTCGLYEHQGYGVDRSVFGVMVMGGMVHPVPDQVYRYGLWRNTVFGRYLEPADALRVTYEPQLIACGYVAESFKPLHITTKLPRVPDLFIQKTGHNLPVALTDAMTAAIFYSSPVAAAVDVLYARRNNDPVLSYKSATPAAQPIGRYLGMPHLL